MTEGAIADFNMEVDNARGAVGRVSQSCGAVGRMISVWSRGPHVTLGSMCEEREMRSCGAVGRIRIVGWYFW